MKQVILRKGNYSTANSSSRQWAWQSNECLQRERKKERREKCNKVNPNVHKECDLIQYFIKKLLLTHRSREKHVHLKGKWNLQWAQYHYWLHERGSIFDVREQIECIMQLSRWRRERRRRKRRREKSDWRGEIRWSERKSESERMQAKNVRVKWDRMFPLHTTLQHLTCTYLIWNKSNRSDQAKWNMSVTWVTERPSFLWETEAQIQWWWQEKIVKEARDTERERGEREREREASSMWPPGETESILHESLF